MVTKRRATARRRVAHWEADREPAQEVISACGDAADLAWMERAAAALDESRRPYAEKPLRELRRRLGR